MRKKLKYREREEESHDVKGVRKRKCLSESQTSSFLNALLVMWAAAAI